MRLRNDERPVEVLSAVENRVLLGSRAWRSTGEAQTMNACEMIARCARRQNPIPSREGPRTARGQRYRVGTSNGHSAVDYADLPSAMGVARALIEIGYAGVYVRDLLASTGEPEAWLWKPNPAGGGQWVVFTKREAGPARGERTA